jgi:hypothetical protein
METFAFRHRRIFMITPRSSFVIFLVLFLCSQTVAAAVGRDPLALKPEQGTTDQYAVDLSFEVGKTTYRAGQSAEVRF